MDEELLDLRLSEKDRVFLNNMQLNLPLLADILRADLLVYCLDDSGECAVVVAEAKPRTVPPIYPGRLAGRAVTEAENPSVLRALRLWSHERRRNRAGTSGALTLQDLFPIVHDHRVIGVLGVEIRQTEQERLQKKSPIYRSAMSQLRQMLLCGELRAGDRIGPMGEHDGPLVVDTSGRILYISNIAESLYRKLGYTKRLVSTNLKDLGTDETLFFDAVETGSCAEQLVEEGPSVWLRKAIPLVVTSKPSWKSRLLSRCQEIEGALLVIQDVTEERRKERELLVKAAMIREVHHRVKNNLQTIAALLRLQARRVHSDDALDLLNQSVNRILSVAVVHEFLSHDESSIIDVKEVCQRIIAEVTQGILDPDKCIKISLEGSHVYLPSQQATSCALIVNELLQNAVEHGFSNRVEGRIVVTLEDMGNELVVEIADNGAGLGQGFRVGSTSSLGLQIVQTLVKEDLKGRFELINGDGAKAVVTFPKLWRNREEISWAAVK